MCHFVAKDDPHNDSPAVKGPGYRRTEIVIAKLLGVSPGVRTYSTTLLGHVRFFISRSAASRTIGVSVLE